MSVGVMDWDRPETEEYPPSVRDVLSGLQLRLWTAALSGFFARIGKCGIPRQLSRATVNIPRF